VQTIMASVHGAINMLGIAERTKAKILQAIPGRSTATRRLCCCYDEGKCAAETLIFDNHRQHGLGMKVARIFNTWVPRMPPNDGRVGGTLIVKALRDEPIMVFGDGAQSRSFCFVDDLHEGSIRLMANPDHATDPIDLGPQNEFTRLDVVQHVVELTGSRSEIVFEPLPQDYPRQRQPDITLARQTLGSVATVDVAEGLDHIVVCSREELARADAWAASRPAAAPTD
jgi:UDP-glucuronate decarboxylase